jgi:hypothetical protein
MANIFGGVEPPAWLQNIARPVDGRDFGMLLGGAVNAFQKDEDGERIGFGRGLAESRMNMADPMWKMKAAQTEVGMRSAILQNEMTYQKFNQQKEELAAWQEFAPEAAPWLRMTPEERLKTQAPDPRGSTSAINLIQKIRDTDERLLLQKDRIQLQKDNSKIALENERRAVDWNNAIGAATPEVQAQIAELPNQGWVVDANGRRLTPSTQALTALNAHRKANGMVPWGIKPTEVVKADKPLSVLGKLISDKDAAVKNGASKEILAEYDAAIEKQSGAIEDKQPSIMTLPNGQVAAWIPGSKGLHILKDPQQEMKARVVFEEWKQANKAYNSAISDTIKVKYRPALDAAEKKLEGLFKATTTPAPAADPNSASAGGGIRVLEVSEVP